MERRDLDEIIACRPQERSHFRYFKDYYALQLLGWPWTAAFIRSTWASSP